MENQRLIFRRSAKVPNLFSKTDGTDTNKKLSRAKKPAPTRRQRQDLETDGYDASPVYIMKPVSIPAMTQVTIPVQTDAREVIFLEPKPSLQFRHGLRVASGVHDAAPGHPFYLVIANFTSKSGTLPKGVIIAYAKRSALPLPVPDEGTARDVSAALHIPTTTSAKGTNVVGEED